ncbi:MAG TPA: fused MFS/spermidine synthase [Syntrophobacteria bacterium]|nr:fused MFS/spermidine synthase [Syntrophobacteria bacterium]
MNRAPRQVAALGETTPRARHVQAVAGRTAALWLYGCTIFLSAFLLFQVQPIIGKMVLPWFGGVASVWTICLLFFQSLLLTGYLYSHWLIRLLPCRAGGLIHIGVLSVSLTALPITLKDALKPTGGEDPALLLLALLALSIGLPYVLLSTTGPLLQAWFAREHPRARPYRLFALSNLGSLTALLSYPVAIEPTLKLRTQSLIWSGCYGAFVLLGGILAYRASRVDPRSPPVEPGEARAAVGRSAFLLWLVLAACPSVLLVAMTSHLTQNVAPVPLFWVAPLSLYLLSFILCFERDRWYRRTWCLPLFLLGVVATCYLLGHDSGSPEIRMRTVIYLGSLFACFMVCHGELARRRPEPAHLTFFYLMVASGGAIGGVFTGIAAPRWFNGDYELAIGLVLTTGTALSVVFGSYAVRLSPVLRQLGWLAIGLVTLAVGAVLADTAIETVRDARLLARNFYGTLRLADRGTGEERQRKLWNGAVIHGTQFLTAAGSRRPTTYYGERAGVGLAIVGSRTHSPQRVGLIGLGAGTLAAYGRPGDYYRFYEINPLCIEIARREFTYLRDSQAEIDVTLGDGRLSLESEPSQEFDVLVVDAFTGDSIPVHLLTAEAFALYLRHLKPDGVLAFHITNMFLDLRPVLAQVGRRIGKEGYVVYADGDENSGTDWAVWVLFTTDETRLALEKLGQPLQKIQTREGVNLWSDDYSSVFSVLR